MEGSSMKEEERTMTFFFYNPCSFFVKALRTLFKCLGFESTETNMCSSQSQAKEEEETSLSKPPSGACPVADSANYSPDSSKKSSQQAADPPSTTTESLNASSTQSGRRRSGSSQGPPPQHN